MSKKNSNKKNTTSVPSILEKGEEDMRLNGPTSLVDSLSNNYIEEQKALQTQKKNISSSMFDILKYTLSFGFFAFVTGLAVKFYFFSKKKTNDIEEQN